MDRLGLKICNEQWHLSAVGDYYWTWLGLGITQERLHAVFTLWWLLGDVWDMTPILNSHISKPDLAADSNLYRHVQPWGWESDVETELPFGLGGGDSKACLNYINTWSELAELHTLPYARLVDSE